MDESKHVDRKPKSYYVDYTKQKFRRRGQSYGPNASNNSRYKNVPDIILGQRGFLITSVDEVKSYLEMRNLLEQYFHEIYDVKTKSGAVESESTEDALESELKHLRLTRPFKQMKTHCRNSIFISIVSEFSYVDPVLLADKFFEDLAEKKEIKTSNTNRVLPVMDTFRNNVTSAKQSVATILAQIKSDDIPKKFFIEFQTRGNYKMESEDKQKMIVAVAEEIANLRPSWTVSRQDADYMIILVALKHVCCSTVVSNYLKRSKYNVNEFCKDFPQKESREGAASKLVTL